MELFLNIFAFLRPVFFIDTPINIAGINLLELAAIGLSGMLILAIVVYMALYKQLHTTSVDYWMGLFILSCVITALLYPSKTDIKEFVKLILPFATYFAVKNIVLQREQYIKLLSFMIMGSSIPIIMSAVYISQGMGLEKVQFWTGLARYQGVFANPHNLGHFMALIIMAITIYVVMLSESMGELRSRLSKGHLLFLGLLLIPTLYCLYNSYVRTTIIGLGVFFSIYFYFVNKKLLLTMGVVLLLVGIIFSQVIGLIFFDFVEAFGEGGEGLERFGRFSYWAHNLSEFSAVTFDRWIIGAGIGNRVNFGQIIPGQENFWSSHNDFLDIFIQTGIIGFILFIGLQFALFFKIRKLGGKERSIFLALFVSVMVMNLISNSYVARFGIAQMFYLLLAYIEIYGKGMQRENDNSSVSKFN